MSYIRSTTNPENLYVWGGLGGIEFSWHEDDEMMFGQCEPSDFLEIMRSHSEDYDRFINEKVVFGNIEAHQTVHGFEFRFIDTGNILKMHDVTFYYMFENIIHYDLGVKMEVKSKILRWILHKLPRSWIY